MKAINLNGPLDAVVELLEAAGIRATTDPADINAPAVLVGLDSFQPGTLADWQVTAQLVLFVPDNGGARIKTALAELFNQVTAAEVYPDGPVLARMVPLPDGPPLPALTFPLNLES